jgi:putative restriction endonuclease
MQSYQKITIASREYFIVDSIQNLRAEDSFIHRRNKLEEFSGAGEARKYVGSYIAQNGAVLSDFFDYTSWGATKVNGERVYPTIQDNSCFFSKSNLLKYLNDSRVEYGSQEQRYNQNISPHYNSNLDKIINLSSEEIFFSIYDVSDFVESKQSRGYVRSDDEIWSIWRKLILPKISYLSILKLMPTTGELSTRKTIFYFRIFLDYSFRSIVHPKLLNLPDDSVLKSVKLKSPPQKQTARIGGDLYRKKVIDHMAQCPFTKISDERILIASHIKPYNICIKENRADQAVDYLNGLALTPTYDKLFDQGYITFRDNGDLVCGTLLSSYTWDKLNINPKLKNKLRIYPEGREGYLKYHRENVFQDNINEFN